MAGWVGRWRRTAPVAWFALISLSVGAWLLSDSAAMPVRFFAGGRSFLCFARRARWLRITINFLLVALLTLIAVRVVRGCTCHEDRDVANVMQGSYYHTVCTGAALLFLVGSYIQCGLW